MKKCVLLAWVFLISNLCIAQSKFVEGYIVTQAGDTLKGQINDRGEIKNCHEVEFRSGKPGEKTIQFYPKDLLSVHYSTGKTYHVRKVIYGPSSSENLAQMRENMDETRSIGLVEDTLILHLVLQGKASLYSFKGKNDADYYFIAKGDSISELARRARVRFQPGGSGYMDYDDEYLRVFDDYFWDCPLARKKAARISFHIDYLAEVIEQYNACLPGAKKQQKKDLRKTTLSFGLKGGINFSSVKVPSNSVLASFDEKAIKTGMLLGAFCQLNPGRWNEKISLSVELLYCQKGGKESVNEQYIPNPGVPPQQIKINIHPSYLDIGFLLRYRILKTSFSPYIAGGIKTGFVVNKVENAFQISKGGQEEELMPEINKKMSGGIMGLAGISYKMGKKLEVFLEYRIERESLEIQEMKFDYLSKLNNISVGIILF